MKISDPFDEGKSKLYLNLISPGAILTRLVNFIFILYLVVICEICRGLIIIALFIIIDLIIGVIPLNCLKGLPWGLIGISVLIVAISFIVVTIIKHWIDQQEMIKNLLHWLSIPIAYLIIVTPCLALWRVIYLETELRNAEYRRQYDTYFDALRDSTARMTVTVSCEILYNNSVGNEWNKHFFVNKKAISSVNGTIVNLKANNDIRLVSRIVENDTYPDVGRNSSTFRVPLCLIFEHFQFSHKVTVEENRGRYAGNSAVWLVTYNFSPEIQFPSISLKDSWQLAPSDSISKYFWSFCSTIYTPKYDPQESLTEFSFYEVIEAQRALKQLQ